VSRVVRCRFDPEDMARIERLAERVRRIVGVDRCIERTAVLRALVRNGLDLNETREIPVDHLLREAPMTLDCRIPTGDIERLARLRAHIQAQWPSSVPPALASVLRALTRMALFEAETQASFAGFARSVLASRLKRGGQPQP
jgi:hypothetical protein